MRGECRAVRRLGRRAASPVYSLAHGWRKDEEEEEVPRGAKTERVPLISPRQYEAGAEPNYGVNLKGPLVELGPMWRGDFVDPVSVVTGNDYSYSVIAMTRVETVTDSFLIC